MEGNSSHHTYRPGDLNDDLIISLEEAATGKTESLYITRREVCEACAGTGESWRSDAGTCPSCGNKGSVERHKELKVSIPAGVETGMRLRIAGGGEIDTASASCGDLYLTVRVREHELFERRGKHLHARATVSQEQITSGTELIVPTLVDGRKRLRVPPGASNGAVFRLSGLGLRSIESIERGDLFVKIETPARDTSYETTAQPSSAASSVLPGTGTRRASLNRTKAVIAAVIGLSIISVVVFISLGRRHPEPQNHNMNAQPSPITTRSPGVVIATPTPAPLAPVHTPFSLPNGSDITPPQGPRGNNILKIVNDNYFDVAVKLVGNATQKTRRFVYVRAESTAVIKHAPREVCVMRIMSGTDWDSNARKFLYNLSFYEFDKPFDFRRIRYTVSLTPDPSGTLRDIPISEGDFEDK